MVVGVVESKKMAKIIEVDVLKSMIRKKGGSED